METCHQCSDMIDILNNEYHELDNKLVKHVKDGLKQLKTLNFKFCLQHISVIGEYIRERDGTEIRRFHDDPRESIYGTEEELIVGTTFNAENFLGTIKWFKTDGNLSCVLQAEMNPY